jgi:hypothetical protein
MRMPEQKLYIDGGYVDATSGECFETINPASGRVITTVQHAAGQSDALVGTRPLPNEQRKAMDRGGSVSGG